MSSRIPSQFIRFQIFSLLMGGCLAVLANSTPAQAQIFNSNLLLAQQEGEPLPPVPFGQESPQLPPAEPAPTYQPEQNFQPSQPAPNYQPEQNFQPSQPAQIFQSEQNFQPYQPEQFSQYNQNFERYLVFVDGSDFQTLQQIRQLEPSAYIREYQGRNVIQSGVFTRVSNAQQRVNELRSRGIYGTRIIGFANGREIGSIDGDNRRFSGDRNNGNIPKQTSRYYVAIPTTSEQLPAIAAQVRQNLARFSQDLGRSGGVLERRQPRGPHVAVGPFADRLQAQEWNKYLRNIGYGDARVYYGK
uniref:SPOR domain-containing protein n=1 Tax=Desmonostoc muscorum LEGE 12446 TaxID=1828758 RepID=A0A8J6ZSC9_DESMC